MLLFEAESIEVRLGAWPEATYLHKSEEALKRLREENVMNIDSYQGRFINHGWTNQRPELPILIES